MSSSVLPNGIRKSKSREGGREISLVEENGRKETEERDGGKSRREGVKRRAFLRFAC